MSNQSKSANKDDKRAALVINMEEHLDFNPIADSRYVSSKGLCEMVSELFRNVFADYEGCAFEMMPGTNQPTIALFFNHKNYGDIDMPVACSKEIDDESTKNSTLRNLRVYNRSLREGDRYYLTADGISALTEFLIGTRSIYKQNNQPDWKKIVAEVADPNSMFYGPGAATQYTKVSFLDPAKIVTKLFGETDSNGHKWEYGIRVVRSMPTVGSMLGAPSSANNWMLGIDRVCEENVLSLARDFGLSITSGLSIVR